MKKNLEAARIEPRPPTNTFKTLAARPPPRSTYEVSKSISDM